MATEDERKQVEPRSVKEKDQILSAWYCCPHDECTFSVGMLLPHSKYSNQLATSAGDLAEKVTLAMSSKMTDEEKEVAFKKADDLLLRAEKLPVSPECLKICWKAVFQKCPHQAEAFKSSLGKPLDDYEVEDIDMCREMITYLNNGCFWAVKNMDIVVVGGENAQRFKSAINANYWPMMLPDESELRARVTFGSKIKSIIFMPNEKLIFGNGSNFDAATQSILQTMNTLKEFNNCELIMLPIFRHLDYPERSQQFIEWYKDAAAKDSRLVGTREVDEMKLIHWLHATPSNKDETNHVGANGILKELGTQKLVQYLNLLGYECAHRKLLAVEKADVALEAGNQNLNPPVRSNGRDPAQKVHSNVRGNGGYRGKSNNRGFGDRGRFSHRQHEDQRGVKRKVESWMDNSNDRPSTSSSRRRKEQQP